MPPPCRRERLLLGRPVDHRLRSMQSARHDRHGFGVVATAAVDKMTISLQFVCVQRGDVTHNSKCKRDLDSKLQRRRGALLNTSRQAHAVCGAVSLRIAPSQPNRCAGDLLLMVEPLTGPASAGARANGARGQKTSRRREGKRQSFACCSPSMPTTRVTPVACYPRQPASRATLRLQHSEDCGFLSLFDRFEDLRQGGWGFPYFLVFLLLSPCH